MNKRPHYLFIFVACFLMLAGALLIFQQAFGLDPCPLCILQRIVIISIGLIALVAYLHDSEGMADKVYGGLLVLGGLISIGIATRQVWILNTPREETASCGPGLEVWLDKFIDLLPQGAVTEKLFRATADCADAQMALFGLDVPEITYPVFLALLVYIVWLFFKRNEKPFF